VKPLFQPCFFYFFYLCLTCVESAESGFIESDRNACIVGHKSQDPCCFHKKCMEAGVMIFVAHCTSAKRVASAFVISLQKPFQFILQPINGIFPYVSVHSVHMYMCPKLKKKKKTLSK